MRSGTGGRAIRVSAVPCGSDAPARRDGLIDPADGIKCVRTLAKSAIDNDEQGNYARPLPTSVVAMLSRMIDELDMAEKSMRYESGREAIAVVARELR